MALVASMLGKADPDIGGGAGAGGGSQGERIMGEEHRQSAMSSSNTKGTRPKEGGRAGAVDGQGQAFVLATEACWHPVEGCGERSPTDWLSLWQSPPYQQGEEDTLKIN